MSIRDEVLIRAQHWLGTPYKWGGTGDADGGVDCSGFIIDTYRSAGVTFSPGRPTASQIGHFGTSVPLADAVAGDVVYIDEPGPTDHVGLYLGGGKMVDAPYTGAKVRVDPVGTFTSIRRIIPDTSVGSLGGVLNSILNNPVGVGGDLVGAAGDAAGNAVDSIATSWAKDAGGLALKVLAVGTGVALVVVGAVHTVRGGD